MCAAGRRNENSYHVEICRDPDDNKFIDCACDAKCIYIVSGDKDLLSVKKYNNVKIVTVAEFLSNETA
ncbi:MAG: putative toxin-antitoxin system toxin component, PIN family [Lachnospiraceae bacterium]|nr:putative toxin-antitoxin system toxin component, PIN family [Lachnospiraceae bacterium]